MAWRRREFTIAQRCELRVRITIAALAVIATDRDIEALALRDRRARVLSVARIGRSRRRLPAISSRVRRGASRVRLPGVQAPRAGGNPRESGSGLCSRSGQGHRMKVW
jgi:hypothetical protein